MGGGMQAGSAGRVAGSVSQEPSNDLQLAHVFN